MHIMWLVLSRARHTAIPSQALGHVKFRVVIASGSEASVLRRTSEILFYYRSLDNPLLSCCCRLGILESVD